MNGVCVEEGKGGVILKDAKESIDISISPSNMDQPFMDYRIELQKCLNEYIKIYPHINHMNKFDIVENYNIQHYPLGWWF